MKFKKKLEIRQQQSDLDKTSELDTTIQRKVKRNQFDNVEFEIEELKIALEENESEFQDLMSKIQEYFVAAKGSNEERQNYKKLERGITLQKYDNAMLKAETAQI